MNHVLGLALVISDLKKTCLKALGEHTLSFLHTFETSICDDVLSEAFWFESQLQTKNEV